MHSAKQAVNSIFPGQFFCVIDGIYNSCMSAPCNNNKSLVFDSQDNSLIVLDQRISLHLSFIDLRIMVGKSFFKTIGPRNFPSNEYPIVNQQAWRMVFNYFV